MLSQQLFHGDNIIERFRYHLLWDFAVWMSLAAQVYLSTVYQPRLKLFHLSSESPCQFYYQQNTYYLFYTQQQFGTCKLIAVQNSYTSYLR